MENEEQKARHEQWQKIIEEQEVNGLSQAKFCKERNISSAQLGYYRGVLTPKQIVEGSFTPISIKQPLACKDIRILLPNGFQCAFSSDLSSTAIKELMKVLLQC